MTLLSNQMNASTMGSTSVVARLAMLIFPLSAVAMNLSIMLVGPQIVPHWIIIISTTTFIQQDAVVASVRRA